MIINECAESRAMPLATAVHGKWKVGPGLAHDEGPDCRQKNLAGIMRGIGAQRARRSFSFDQSRWQSIDAIFLQAAAKVAHKVTMHLSKYGGAPCIEGTRIPVYAILELVEAGYTHKRILRSFPLLSADDLEAALRFAVLVMER